MNKSLHIIYLSLIIITISGFSINIKQVEENQDKRCWEMIKEIAESKEL
ncbi:hypothetical protein N9D96_02380 [Gammaproteobacteria bacterium]|jgi:hypothetical protein|nr:hypothetical protein [Gammaproteobacteria bacterium]